MLLAIVHTLISRFLFLCFLIVAGIPIIIFLMVPLERRLKSPVACKMLHYIYRFIIRFSFVPVTIRGAENITKTPAIIAANHQSSLDIPLVGSLVNGHSHVWLATSYLLKFFLFRLFIPRTTILIDMSSPMKGMRSLMQVFSLTRDTNTHIMIFPEGQRYPDDEVHDFYGGFAILAKKTGRPVVPVRIFNANKVYPSGAFLMRWHPITLVVGEPMILEESESDDAFKQRVYQWFVEQKEE